MVTRNHLLHYRQPQVEIAYTENKAYAAVIYSLVVASQG